MICRVPMMDTASAFSKLIKLETQVTKQLS